MIPVQRHQGVADYQGAEHWATKQVRRGYEERAINLGHGVIDQRNDNTGCMSVMSMMSPYKAAFHGFRVFC